MSAVYHPLPDVLLQIFKNYSFYVMQEISG
jgi:hypothetical protein